MFTPTGLLKGKQTQKETNEKKEKLSSKISLNEVMFVEKYGLDVFRRAGRKRYHVFQNHVKLTSLPKFSSENNNNVLVEEIMPKRR